jgi:hypothetical protein
MDNTVENRATEPNTEITAPTRAHAELRDFYGVFCEATIKELQNAIIEAGDTDEKAFYRKLLNLKLQTEQEKIVGERLV